MINLIRILREFELRPVASDQHPNQVFDSYVVDDGGELRRFARIIETAGSPDVDSKIVMGKDQVVGSGEDPRAFVWRGSPCIYAMYHSRDHGYLNRIYVANERRWITLIAPKKLPAGKNWVPFVRNGDLFFIHGFSPFRVVQARFANDLDDFMLLDVVATHKLRLPKSHDGFARFRGGSNALDVKGTVLGFGHTNETTKLWRRTRHLVHRPFLFTYRPGHEVAIFEPERRTNGAYSIVDPTSLFFHDGALCLVTCETERVWGITPQRGRICLYRIDVGEDAYENGFGPWRRRIHRWSSDKAA